MKKIPFNYDLARVLEASEPGVHIVTDADEPVKILSWDGDPKFPIVGLVDVFKDGTRLASDQFDTEGRSNSCDRRLALLVPSDFQQSLRDRFREVITQVFLDKTNFKPREEDIDEILQELLEITRKEVINEMGTKEVSIPDGVELSELESIFFDLLAHTNLCNNPVEEIIESSKGLAENIMLVAKKGILDDLGISEGDIEALRNSIKPLKPNTKALTRILKGLEKLFNDESNQ